MKNANDAIYELKGEIPLQKAVPFGLQHVLAMFVANIAPILIVAGAVKMSPEESGALVQSAMIVAGIGSLLQMFPLWRLGSGLPIIMGISFTFVSVACVIGTKYGYGAVLGAALIGGILEGILGLGATWWKKFVPPIVSASVVTAIGFSLLPIGANSFGGGFGAPDFGDAKYLIVGSITLVACLVFNLKAHSFYKQLSVLFGLIVGYIAAYFYGMVDLSRLSQVSIISIPSIMKEIREKEGSVLFVGDGINDAPVLAGADAGAAMGSGADAAIEAADLVFLNSDVRAIPEAIRLSRKVISTAWQNVGFALFVKIAHTFL